MTNRGLRILSTQTSTSNTRKFMPNATAAVHFQNLKSCALKCVADSNGIRQSEVAKYLGIPSKFDHNWMTKGLLDGLVEEGRITKDENKLFHIAAN